MKFTEVNVNVGFCFCLRFYNFLFFFHLHSAAMYFSDIQNLFHFRKLWFLPTSHQLWGFPSGKLEKEKLSESRRVLLHSVKKWWRRQGANVIIEKTIINTYLPFPSVQWIKWRLVCQETTSSLTVDKTCDVKTGQNQLPCNKTLYWCLCLLVFPFSVNV